PAGVTTVPNCTTAIGFLNYSVANSGVGTINTNTNQITANEPGTTAINVTLAGTGSSAGYFSTCPPQSISVTLSDGTTTGVITRGVQQNLITRIFDTNNLPISGLTLDYQSTNPIAISATNAGSVTASFPGVASVYAICQPAGCNPSPINELGLYGTGLSISSNPVNITTPGTISDFVWFAAPGQSQYFVPIELLTGTIGYTVRLPYVPNSMVMDETGTNLYFGSARAFMVYNAGSNTISKQDSNAAVWTPDSKTLYITDNAAINNPPAITGPTDPLYVDSQNAGWSAFQLPPS